MSENSRIGNDMENIKKQVPVSVFVLTCDRPKDLEKCLSSISEQTHQNIEVIVVDNGKVSLAKDIAHKFGCEYIYSPANTLPSLFNTGWRA